MQLTQTESVMLLQLALTGVAQYQGRIDGVIDDSVKAGVATLIANGMIDDGYDADEMILTLKALGYDDELKADGIAGDHLNNALRKAFDIPIPETQAPVEPESATDVQQDPPKPQLIGLE